MSLIAEDMNRTGYNEVVFRSDNDTALLSVLRAVKGRWAGEIEMGVFLLLARCQARVILR